MDILKRFVMFSMKIRKNDFPKGRFILQIRYEYVDAVKGLAILCITLLHFENGIFPGWLNTWISFFMITAFYFISGWISGIKDTTISPSALFFKRLSQLGIPYLWFSLLILLFDLLLFIFGQMEIKIVLRDIYKTFTLRGIGTLWFLPVLLFSEWLFCLIRNNPRRYWAIVIASGTTLIADYLYTRFIVPMVRQGDIYLLAEAPLRPIIYSLNAWPVIGLGFLCGHYLKIISGNRLFFGCMGILTIAWSLWLVIQPPFCIYYVNGLLCKSLPAFGFLCIFLIQPTNPAMSFFSYWGRNSLVLMCTHFSITQVVLQLIDRKIFHHNDFSGISTLLYFAVAILLTYPMVCFFNHKASFMLGKKITIRKK